MKKGKKYNKNTEDAEFVRRCIIAGMTVVETADCLNLSDETLRKYYRYEIMTSRAILKGKAVKVLDDCLSDGSLDAAKYVLGRLAGWSETTKAELTGKDGAPIETKDVSDMDRAKAIATIFAAAMKAKS